MLHADLDRGPFKRTTACDPLIDDYPKAILIAGSSCLTPYLLRCHIGKRATHILVWTQRG